MKAFITSLLSIMLILPCLAQAQANLYVGDYVILPNQTIEVPIKIDGLENFVSLQFTINWDKNVLSFQSINNLTSALPGFGNGDVSTTNTADGRVSMAWLENTIACTPSAPAGTTIFTLTFMGIGEHGEFSPITITDEEVIDCSFNIAPIVVSDGSIALPVTLNSFTASPENQAIRLNFICTHNSRRSHLSQIWAQTMAAYYNIKNVNDY